MSPSHRELGPGLRLAGFGLALTLAFGAGLGIGRLVGTVGDIPAPPGTEQVDHQPAGH